jgi:hypothetical protein
MSHVTVHFVGICTHISQSTVPELPAQQRVVLVNARGVEAVRETVILPHDATLTIGTEVIPLRGCTVRLVAANSPSDGPVLDDTFKDLPNLTHLMEGMGDLGSPSVDVVLNRSPEHSACYFDIGFGTLSACREPKGAAAATLDVDSPEPVSLEITPWDGSMAVQSYSLDDGSVVLVANTDLQAANDDERRCVDFLLHYTTATKMPHAPQVPQAIALPPCPFTHAHLTVGAGCSNSNYP